jgi:hypothetical protein
MIFHLPSFLLGCVTGVGLKAAAPRLKPVMVELAAVGYRLVDVLSSRAVRGREAFEDILAEARARARREPAVRPNN